MTEAAASATLAQLVSRISAISKCVTEAGEDPIVR